MNLNRTEPIISSDRISYGDFSAAPKSAAGAAALKRQATTTSMTMVAPLQRPSAPVVVEDEMELLDDDIDPLTASANLLKALSERGGSGWGSTVVEEEDDEGVQVAKKRKTSAGAARRKEAAFWHTSGLRACSTASERSAKPV